MSCFRSYVIRTRVTATCGALLVGAATVVAAVGPLSGTAAASSPWGQQALWVSSAAEPSGADQSCQSAAYSTVQAAVTAAESGHGGQVPVIDICPGTYSEQVTIEASVELTRAPVAPNLGPVTIQLPAAVGGNQSTGLSTTSCQANDVAKGVEVPQSVIEVCGDAPDVNVDIRDLTVKGDWPSSVCDDSLYDVLVGGGATLELTGSDIEQAGAYPLNGCQGGVGIQVGNAETGQVGHATLSGDTVVNYQKNGITIDGSGSTASIDDVVVTGIGATPTIAQNGIQVSFGATARISHSTITGNNYTGSGVASSSGVLVVGGGGSTCGIGANSALARDTTVSGNQLDENDVGIAFFNTDPTCTKSPATPTRDVACDNRIENDHGYPGGTASADANRTGYSSTIGYQAGVEDTGTQDVICGNVITGAGYAPLDSTRSLPNPAPPAFVRPIDTVSVPAIDPTVYGNTYGGMFYAP
jgi:hypothetical protein